MDDETQLVLAMPRRELFRIQGYVPPHDLAVLESLAEESWFASPALLASDFDAKEVRIGLIVLDPGSILLSDQGVMLHTTAVPPEAGQLGSSSLASLKRYALVAGRQLLGTSTATVELCGFCNEDALQECRGIFLLVYRFRVPAGTKPPVGMTWVERSRLASVAIDPVSALVLEATT